jgi:hypothetical protein
VATEQNNGSATSLHGGYRSALIKKVKAFVVNTKASRIVSITKTSE